MSSKYSVVVTYSFEESATVYPCKTFEGAKKMLKDLYEEEVRIDEEEGNANECSINEDGTEAIIINYRRNGDTDTTTWRIGETSVPTTEQAVESQPFDIFVEQLENAVARMGYTVLGQDAEDVGVALIVRDKAHDMDFRVANDAEAN